MFAVDIMIMIKFSNSLPVRTCFLLGGGGGGGEGGGQLRFPSAVH